MPQEVTAALAALQARDIPGEVCALCKDLLLDTLACAVAGHAGDEIAQVTALAAALAPRGDSSIIGSGRSSLAGATLLNAYLVTATAMGDVHRATMTHVGPVVIPPALAIAERDAR